MESHGKPFSQGGRRLFEFLQEPQEPFLLQVYLLEKDSINCWPTETCRKILPKNWNLKLRKALNWENRVPPVDGIGGQSRSGWFSRWRWKTMRDSKQLSPVSVFELHSEEGCSAHNHSIEEENTSSTSPLIPETGDEEELRYNQHKNDRSSKLGLNHVLQQCGKEFEERIFGCCESLGHHRAGKLAMEVQVVSFGAASIAEWMDVGRFRTTTEWNRFPAEAMEIGLVIEGFIFDEIREEVVVEMLGSHCFVLRNSL